MTKYGQVALLATEYIQKGQSAEQAWENASCELLVKGSSSQIKGCPKGAFMGLFSKDQSKRNGKNAVYAQKALSILKNNPNHKYSKSELWSLVVNEPIKHNAQMDVVMTLWDHNLI